jgi:hypothetical protein
MGAAVMAREHLNILRHPGGMKTVRPFILRPHLSTGNAQLGVYIVDNWCIKQSSSVKMHKQKRRLLQGGASKQA